MNYEKNRAVLTKIVENKESIRPLAKHRNSDGSLDIEGNLKIWNHCIEQFELIQLWEAGAPGYNEEILLQPQPSIAFIPAPKESTKSGTIIVAHGGGFELRTGCEGTHIADYFNKAGYAVAILTYRLKPYTRFDAIQDMQRAIRVLRSKKEELGISNKIAVMGFSAGGMLSGNCATHFDYGREKSSDFIEHFSCRPDAAVIAYGAMSFVAFPGRFMLDNPFDDAKRAQAVYLAPDKNITIDTPPFFIWQTNSDDPRHSLNLAKELSDVGIPFELHCFPDGEHGMALADGNNDLDMKIPHVMHWCELCVEWLVGVGI